MVWTVQWDPKAEKNLETLGAEAKGRILRYLRKRIATEENPRRFGEGYRFDMKGLWKYRVDAYRIVCRIQDETVTVLVLNVDHRRDIYDRH